MAVTHKWLSINVLQQAKSKESSGNGVLASGINGYTEGTKNGCLHREGSRV